MLTIGKVLDELMLRDVGRVHSAILHFQTAYKPLILHNNFASMCTDRSVSRFVNVLYALSPYYLAQEARSLPRFGRLTELALVHVETKSGFPIVTHTAPPDDELFFSYMSHNGALIYSLARSHSEGQFTAEEERLISARVEVIFTLLAALSGELSTNASGSSAVASQSFEADAPHGDRACVVIGDQFGKLLSAREKSVVAMTLEGSASHIIAQRLEISPHTVRAHLRNAYAKLRVRNKLELCGLFMRTSTFHTATSSSLSVK